MIISKNYKIHLKNTDILYFKICEENFENNNLKKVKKNKELLLK